MGEVPFEINPDYDFSAKCMRRKRRITVSCVWDGVFCNGALMEASEGIPTTVKQWMGLTKTPLQTF